MKIVLLLIFLNLTCLNIVFGLDKINQEFVDHVKSQKIAYTNVNDLHTFLIKPAKNESDKAELFYYWIAENIAYDFVKYDAIIDGGDIEDYNVLTEKKGVCHDYSTLFKALCDLSNIECHYVSGYSKGGFGNLVSPFKIDHAWNVVKLNGKYQFIDCTWASGSGSIDSNGKGSYYKGFKLSYAFVTSNEFRENHLPGSPKWQLLDYPVSLSAFENNKAFVDMYSEEGEKYNYIDSIKTYNGLSKLNKVIQEYSEIFNFNKTYKGAFDVGWRIENMGYDISQGPYSQENLEKGIECYKKAKKWYVKSFDIINAGKREPSESQIEIIRRMNQRIKYNEYKIKHG